MLFKVVVMEKKKFWTPIKIFWVAYVTAMASVPLIMLLIFNLG